MSHCNQCGNPLKPNAKFCGKCGTLVSDASKEIGSQQDASCQFCGNIMLPDIKFCTHCGKPATGKVTIVYQNSSAPIPAQIDAKNPDRKVRWRKVAGISVAMIVISVIGALAVYYFGSYEPQADVPTDMSALYREDPVDINRIDSAASMAEQVFLRADTLALAGLLSPTTLVEQRPHFARLQPYMEDYGKVFRNRKLLYATALYAVYEFETTRGSFTAEFCLGADGKWKLMRF